ncbi:MAG: hypothetical protein QW767_01800 [Thermoprotei archaeon]
MERTYASGSDSDVSIEIGQLRGDLVQLSELMELERSYVERLVEALKQLHGYVGTLVEVNSGSLGVLTSAAKKAYLAPQAEVVFEYEGGRMESRPLIEFDPEHIVSIINDAAPAFKKLLAEKRKTVSTRINLMEKVLKEFEKMPGKQEATRKASRAVEEDLVESSLTQM